jgi:UDP-3-O-[3-hydroxymyristoyl] glucosamine N-acyltransferase
MADPRFFNRAGPFAIADILAACGAAAHNPAAANANARFTDVAPLDAAGPDQISFIDNPKYRGQFTTTKAGACIMRADMVDQAPSGTLCLIAANPYKAYALAAQLFYPSPVPIPGVSPHAVVDPSATLGSGVRIDHHAVIGAGVTLGDNVWIEPGVIIGDNVTIGAHCRIGAGTTISHALIGQRVRLYPGVRIGQDGFGFAIDPKGFVKVPQLGRVIIEDFCEIGANTCIDRGAGPDTVIGTGTWIDGLVKIGHNVKVGRGCIIVAQVGISGSTVIEDFVAIGGQAGMAGHLHIGKGAQIAAGSGVITNVDPGTTVMGYPALPKTQFMRHVAYLNRMTKRTGSSNP